MDTYLPACDSLPWVWRKKITIVYGEQIYGEVWDRRRDRMVHVLCRLADLKGPRLRGASWDRWPAFYPRPRWYWDLDCCQEQHLGLDISATYHHRRLWGWGCKELAQPITGCSNRQLALLLTTCTTPGQHSRADLICRETEESVMNTWEQESWP